MDEKTRFQRRQLLKFAGLNAALAVSPDCVFAKSRLKTRKPSTGFRPDVEIKLTLKPDQVTIFKGAKTRIWTISGELIKGPVTALENHSTSYLGPTFRLHKGQKVRIILSNRLPSASILHWHGMHVPSEMDGNPRDAIDTGETYVYEFEIRNRAGTYWYHAHTHDYTGIQVYKGLAGLMLVSDDEEQALQLPKTEHDIPLMIQDRTFNTNNQLSYVTHMMQRMRGFLGNQILINGDPDYTLPVEARAYRLRLLNGSNSRIYKLGWNNELPITVIGTDGGLLEQPVTLPYLMLAPGQRREIWVDFSRFKTGTELTMRNLDFQIGMQHRMMGGMRPGHRGGMMGRGMTGHNKSQLGNSFPVFKVQVTKRATTHDDLPLRLSHIDALSIKNASNSGSPRTITLSMRHMSALLNGRSYTMNDIQPDERIPVNTLQYFELDNDSTGMMSMPHPMHFHGEPFQIVKRQINPGLHHAFQTVREGFIDSGWHDTVLIMPGEKITLLKPFNDYKGLFMYHCHNLEHEDLGMMRDFQID
ncbi:MAG: multicopper oxidase domain-containing protein [Gammaproteobacteria bacterium]|nr:multicopper oxidase domain-containing protein [Gammaproteobacteria bacterium]